MKQTKQSGQTWNAEARRVERKDRLAELRAQDGRRRTSTGHRTARSWLVIAAVVLVLLGALAYALYSAGMPQRLLPIMKVDGQKITVAQFNYWYGNLLGQYGIEPSSSDLAQTMSTDADGKTTTYYDYLIATTATQLQRIYAEASLAREAGLTLGEYQASVDSQIESIITSAGSAGYADMMLKQAYGPGCTLGAVRELYENLYLSNKYSETKTGEADVSAEALNAYYTENMDTIDQVTYRAFSFSFSVSSTATAAEKEQAKTAAKTKADAFLADVGSEKDFQELALAATAEDDRDTYKEKDGSLIKGRTYSGLTTPVGDWAFDKARKAGDTSVLENTTDYTVVYFIKREKPENLQASVRHILIAAKRDSATEAELAQAKATAETILAEITDEASFIERVRTYSEDVPSIGDGGLYTGLDENSSYVTEFLDWAVDETRKVGDTGIVQTDYGYHVMFFSGRTPAWENTVRTILQDDAYEEFISDKLVNDARFNYTLNSFAMRFVI